jgi:molybdopterin converting factor small subunit
MATVSIPQVLRPSAEGRSSAEAHGSTVREVIDDLVRQFPGLTDRIVDAEGKRPEIMLAVGADEVFDINQAVAPDAEVFILPAIAGGAILDFGLVVAPAAEGTRGSRLRARGL